jgi:hypothetical protein
MFSISSAWYCSLHSLSSHAYWHLPCHWSSLVWLYQLLQGAECNALEQGWVLGRMSMRNHCMDLCYPWQFWVVNRRGKEIWKESQDALSRDRDQCPGEGGLLKPVVVRFGILGVTDCRMLWERAPKGWCTQGCPETASRCSRMGEVPLVGLFQCLVCRRRSWGRLGKTKRWPLLVRTPSGLRSKGKQDRTGSLGIQNFGGLVSTIGWTLANTWCQVLLVGTG